MNLSRATLSPRRLCLYSGIVGPIAWLGLIAFAGAITPHFDHTTHYISELAARGSATERWMRIVAFGFTGLLYVCLAGGLSATLPRTWMAMIASALIAVEGVGRMGAGVFPCDPGCVPISTTQDLHKLSATIGFVSGIVAAILWGFLLRGHTRFQGLAWPSIVCGIVAAVSLILMSWEANPVHAAGFFEHLATAALSVWIVLLATAAVRYESRH